MHKKLYWLLTAILLASTDRTDGQQSKTIPTIGYLSASSAQSQAPWLEGLQRGLREIGYVEGKNIFIESRYADGMIARLPSLANELVRLKVEAIVTGGAGATRPAKEATLTIPIVMGQDTDPVGNGFVASLAHPGGNITGLSSLSPELAGKRLELLKEIIPRLSRLTILGESKTPGESQVLKETEIAAVALGVELQYVDISAVQNIESAFRAAIDGHSDAVLTMGGPLFDTQRVQAVNIPS